MPGTTVLREASDKPPHVTMETIVEVLDHLPPEYLDDVMQFIQFLEYKAQGSADNYSEDDALWDAVQANQTYKKQYSDEKLEHYKSGADFLKKESLAFAYQQMAKDERRESEALEWAEATIGDISVE